MDVIELMLTGEMDMCQFVELIKSDSMVQDALRNLIPTEAIANRDHDFWKCISFDSLQKNNFDFLMHLYWVCRFDGSLGDNLNIFGSISRVYMYRKPKLSYTTKHVDSYDLYLNVIKDCFDGPEVRGLVEQIIRDAITIQTKKGRLDAAKKEIQLMFHTTDSKKPRWIQGPQWPMGIKTPMRFLSQKRKGEFVQYLFLDIDTNQTRIIEQFY